MSKLKKKKINPFPALRRYWNKNWLHKTVVIIISILIILLIGMYSIARWYIASEAHIPLQLGVTYVPDYASSLGLNPNQTLNALLNINVKQFRLTSYWSDIESTKGVYNFKELDHEFKAAEQHNAKIILVVGLRQPRWPECHAPSWIANESTATWEKQLYSFIKVVVNRYKNYPNLEAYQVENEYFLKGFGDCTNFSRNRLIKEYNLVKSLDPKHPIIITRSNNAIGFPIGQPVPSEYSISIYKRVWDANLTHRYLEYPFPAWYYAFLAGFQKIFLGKNMMIGEMQAEAWPPNFQTIPETSLKEQNKSINATRLQNRFNFARATGMRNIDMWGAEYWYYRMVKLHDPSLWNVAKKEFQSNK